MKSPAIDQKSFLASASSSVESSWCGVGEESPSYYPRGFSFSSVPIPQCLRPQCLLSRFPQRATHSRKNTWQDLWTELMQSRQVFSRNRVIFHHRSKRNHRAFVRCFPIRQEILNVSQIGIAFHRFCHHYSRPDCNSTADVPSFTLRTALSTIPFVSDRCGVDVQWFQDESSHASPTSMELSVWVTFGFHVGSKNFCKLFAVSWEVLVLHG